MSTQTEPVIVFVPVEPGSIRYATECTQFCHERRYRIAAITSSAHAVAQMLAENRVTRVVVARPEHARAAVGAEVALDPDDRPDDEERPRRLR